MQRSYKRLLMSVGAVGVTLPLVLLGIRGDRSSLEREIEESFEGSLIDAFPDEVKGAREIRKFGIKGSEYCLVHIRQLHTNPGREVNADFQSAVEVQQDIYEIINDLASRKFLSIVYYEGLSPRYGEKFYSEDGICILPAEGDELLDRIALLEEETRHKSRLESALMSYFVCTSNGLKMQERDRQVIDLYYGLREDYLLRVGAEDADSRDFPFIYTVFGGAHAWGGRESCGEGYDLSGRVSLRDNIAEWNRANPDKKFSLIEIVPEHYED